MARAAERLGMAVQTVSTQVRELERSLGYVLLKPSGRGVVLTDVDLPPCGRQSKYFNSESSFLR